VSSSCVGVALPALDLRADDRGVTFPTDSVSRAKVSSCLTLGVTLGGSDLVVDVFEMVDRVEGVDVPATRGVRGIRRVLVEGIVGFKERPVLLERSVDIAAPYYACRIWYFNLLYCTRNTAPASSCLTGSSDHPSYPSSGP